MTHTPDIAWPLIHHVAEGWPISEKDAAAIVDALRRPAPAVPDDVAQMIRRARVTPLYEGSGECSSLAEDLADALEAQAAELARLREALTKINVGDGWAAQIARAALTQTRGEKG